MASKFALPDWAFDNVAPPAPEPQPSPEEAEANDVRVRDLNNQFIDYKQQMLFTAPQAFLRQQGSDAISGAEAGSPGAAPSRLPSGRRPEPSLSRR